MSTREVIAYAITHAPKGVKGGPYEADDEGRRGSQSTSLRPGHAVRWRTMPAKERRREILRAVRKVRPHARVIRIVRAERPSPSPSEIAEMVAAQARMPIMVAPSEASAVEVLRELVRAGTTLVGKTPLPKENIRVSLECFADEVRDVRTALARARRVLADSGPDPMPVVRAAMAELAAWEALDAASVARAETGYRARFTSSTAALKRYETAEAAWVTASERHGTARAHRRKATAEYRKAGGK